MSILYMSDPKVLAQRLIAICIRRYIKNSIPLLWNSEEFLYFVFHLLYIVDFGKTSLLFGSFISQDPMQLTAS